MESWGEDGGCLSKRRPKKRGHITTNQSIYKVVILPLIITKMSFWSVELQKCHYGLKMLA